MKIIFFSGLLTALLCWTGELSGQIYIEDGASLYLESSATVYIGVPGITTVEGTLAGSGTLTSTTVNLTTTGKISPGASVGTLNIVGDLNLNDGKYECEINGTSDYDVINVTGTAAINPTNSQLDLTFGYEPALGSSFNIITASAGMTGSWDMANVAITGGGVAEISGGGTIIVALLPVELTSFSAHEAQGQIELNWHTATELNNAGFAIQRSGNPTDREWTTIGNVVGHGTSLIEHSYHFTDVQPLPGENYYRLRQTDFDGHFEFSEVVNVKNASEPLAVRLFPNPATDFVTLAIDTDLSGPATVSLFDLFGKKVGEQSLQLEAQAVRTGIDRAGLPAGVYFAEVTVGNFRQRVRVLFR